jgi:hypothetical protein
MTRRRSIADDVGSGALEARSRFLRSSLHRQRAKPVHTATATTRSASLVSMEQMVGRGFTVFIGSPCFEHSRSRFVALPVNPRLNAGRQESTNMATNRYK